MKRDELLTKLAMELEEWPSPSVEIPSVHPLVPGERWERGGIAGNWIAWHGDAAVTRQDWRAERERLINKPDWDMIPEWANYLCQQETGKWRAYEKAPVLEMRKWFGGSSQRSGSASRGVIPAGHDWRQTLERRPDNQSDAMRECEQRLAGARLNDDARHVTPADLLNRQLLQRCEELKESNAALVDDNRRLRRLIGDLAA